MSASPNLPDGLNSIAVIKPSLDDTLIGHTFTVIYIPLLIALFYFSTSYTRRQPIFILNIVVISLALAVGILLDARAYRVIIYPQNPPPLSWNIAIGVLGAVQSILVDCILLLRLLVVYPWRLTKGYRRAAIYSLPITLKVARVINLILFIKALVDATRHPLLIAEATIGHIWSSAPYLKIEWFMQLFDNSFASMLFLCKLYSSNKSHRAVNSTPSVSFTRTLKTLFYIALSNFIFPVLFSLVQIIVVFTDPNIVVINDIVLVNTSIAVIGAVFATVWSGSSAYARRCMDDGHHDAGFGWDNKTISTISTFHAAPGVVPTTTTQTASTQLRTNVSGQLTVDELPHSPVRVHSSSTPFAFREAEEKSEDLQIRTLPSR